jgi:ATP-binding cassette subfamily C (CFTR/MRP) protein 1
MYLRRGLVLESGTPAALLAKEDTEMGKLVRGHGSRLSSSGSSTPRSSDGDEGTTIAASTPSPDMEVQSDEDLMKPNAGRRESFGKAALLDALPTKQETEMNKEHREKGTSRCSLRGNNLTGSCSRSSQV